MAETCRRHLATLALPGAFPAASGSAWGLPDTAASTEPEWLIWLTVAVCAAGLWWLLRQGHAPKVPQDDGRSH